MSNEEIIQDLLDEVQNLQRQIGGTEHLIKLLVSKLSPEEVYEIDRQIHGVILDNGENSELAKIMAESLRIIR